MSVCVWVCAQCRCCRDQKRVLDPIELELQTVRSCPMWVRGSELKSSGRAICALNHWDTFPALILLVSNFLQFTCIIFYSTFLYLDEIKNMCLCLCILSFLRSCIIECTLALPSCKHLHIITFLWLLFLCVIPEFSYLFLAILFTQMFQ